MRTEFLCISVLRVASGPRVKLASCKSALNPPVPVLVLLFVALGFILRGDLLYVFPCVILFLCFSVLLVLQLPRLGKRELILVLFVRLFVCACLDLSVSSSSWGLGRVLFVIVALPGLFSYLFCSNLSLLYKIFKGFDAVYQFMKTSNCETHFSSFNKEAKPMHQVIQIYMKTVVIMLQFIRVIRNGDWKGHLNALSEFVK